MALQPVIKWTGSKRHLAEEIISHFPREIDTYHEPFCGGASVLFRLLHSNIKVNRYVISDSNKHLTSVLTMVKDKPDQLLSDYTEMHKELSSCGTDSGRVEVYNTIRSRFNTDYKPSDFLFLTRTCTNGLIRFNGKGEFNTSFHHGRLGIKPDKYSKVIRYWSDKLNEFDVEINNSDYRDVNVGDGDFVFLDPPYYSTKASAMYGQALSFDKYCDFLRGLECGYAFTFDGKSTKKDSTVRLDGDLFDKHVYLSSQNSGLSRVVSGKGESVVNESLYIKTGQI